MTNFCFKIVWKNRIGLFPPGNYPLSIRRPEDVWGAQHQYCRIRYHAHAGARGYVISGIP
jgi:hypothetical protein